MRTTLRTGIGVMAIAMLTGASLFADVRSQEKMRMQFGGALGRMVGMFGGKAAKEGMTSEVAVKGDRKLTRTDDRGQLVDLAEEKVHEIDYSDKSYKVATFAEIRKRMEEAREKAREQMEKAAGQQVLRFPASEEDGHRGGLEGDRRKEGGQRLRHPSGDHDSHDARGRQTIETGGGMVLTMDSWLAPPIAAMKMLRTSTAATWRSCQAWSRGRDGPADDGSPGDVPGPWRSAQPRACRRHEARWHGDDDDDDRRRGEEPRADGEGVRAAAGLRRRRPRRHAGAEDDEEKEPEDANAASANRANIMTTNHEVLSVSTDVPADAVAIPAGFKNKT